MKKGKQIEDYIEQLNETWLMTQLHSVSPAGQKETPYLGAIHQWKNGGGTYLWVSYISSFSLGKTVTRSLIPRVVLCHLDLWEVTGESDIIP